MAIIQTDPPTTIPVAIILVALCLMIPMASAANQSATVAHTTEPATRELKKVPEGHVRRVYLEAAGKDKDAVLQGDEFADAVKRLAEIANLSESVSRASSKSADKNSDGVVDWFEFYAFVCNRSLEAVIAPPAPQLKQPDVTKSSTGRPEAKPGSVPGAISQHFHVRPVEELTDRYEGNPELQGAVRESDADQDGVLTWEEYRAFSDKRESIRRQRVRAEFDAVNRERAAYDSGVKARLAQRALERNDPPPQERPDPGAVMARERAEILAKYDANSNGVLDESEWKNYIQALRHQRSSGGKKVDSSADNLLIWTYSFDEDRDGVIDKDEHLALSREAARDIGAMQRPSPLGEELGPIKTKDLLP